MTDYIVPLIVAFTLIYGLCRGVDLYDALICGMRSGLRVCVQIFPAVLTMLVAISMLRESGAIALFSHALAPILRPLGIPEECLPLALLRPFSGSGALSVGASVIAQPGRTAPPDGSPPSCWAAARPASIPSPSIPPVSA